MRPHSSRLVAADARLFRISNQSPARDAIQEFSALELPIVFLTTEDGTTGSGFGYTIGRGGTAMVELLRRELLPQVIGEDGESIRALMDRLEHSIHALTPGCISSNALAAIEIALWDLAGKRAGLPLHRLLGAAKKRVPVYNTDVGWLNRPLDDLVDGCERALRRDGFGGVKLKVGKPDPEEDRERVAHVREAIGREPALMADANQSWTPGEAASRMERLEGFGLYWMEEPLAATDVHAHEQLRARTRIPLAAGESLYAPGQFYEYLHRGALDILQPDVARLGGIGKALEVCHAALAAGLPVATHVSPEISIAVAAVAPNSIFVEYLPHMEPILHSRIRIEDGFAYPFSAPGHGIEFQQEELARFEVTSEYPVGDEEAAA